MWPPSNIFKCNSSFLPWALFLKVIISKSNSNENSAQISRLDYARSAKSYTISSQPASDTRDQWRFLLRCRYLHSHYAYYIREMKIKAYAQLLESYRSLTLEYMAEAFGVTEDYMDGELSRFALILNWLSFQPLILRLLLRYNHRIIVKPFIWNLTRVSEMKSYNWFSFLFTDSSQTGAFIAGLTR